MKKIILSISVLAIIIIVATTTNVKANRSYFVPSITTNNVASTSPDYMLVTGAKLTLDAYTYQTGVINSATLLIQSVASTSAAVQTITIDYSQDGIDWFSIATTTKGYTTSNAAETYTITGNATASTTRIGLPIATPVRFVRASVATSTAKSSIWMQWVPVREMVQ